MRKKLFGQYSHLVLFLAALIVCLVSPRKISTNFMDIIPHTGLTDELKLADSTFTSGQTNSVTMFVEADDFEKAKSGALKLYDLLSKSGLFDELNLDGNAVDVEGLKSYITDNVYLFLDDEAYNKILSDTSGFQEDSIATIFSGFTFSSVADLEKDPFLLSENIWYSLLNKVSSMTGLHPKDGVLTCELSGKHYVMVFGTLKDSTMSLTKSGGVGDIFKIGEGLSSDGLKVYFSGVPFHTFESAGNSRREITLISGFSVLAIIVLFFAVFRNLHILKPILLGLMISLVDALAMLLICFKNFHVMTLIFGTSLIGTCIDYSIHFYVGYLKKAQTENGYDVEKKLFKSLTIGFSSTFFCYLILVFSSYSILKQIAVFCSAGLLGSYLMAIFVYPVLITQKTVNQKAFKAVSEVERKHFHFLPYVAVLTTLLFVFSLGSIKIENNISNLYTPSERMMKGEEKFAELMGYSDSSYAILWDFDEEKLSEKESAFVKDISSYSDCIAVSSYFPSPAQQRRSIKASRKLLPYLETQTDILGLDRAVADNVRMRIEGIDVMSEIPSFLSALNLGKIGDNFYHAVIIRDSVDDNEIRKIADKYEGVHFFRVSEDVSRQLDVLTKKILCLFLIGFVFIVVCLIATLGFKEALRIVIAPYSVISGTVALCVLLGMSLDFFMAVGLVLIVGLGLDYIVFASDKKLTGADTAVKLSFLTTELSFGILALSSFKPVHIFGLTVFIGILIAYICARGK